MAGRPEMELIDEELARRAQAGCRTSFEILAQRYQVPLLRFVDQRIHSTADAEDIVQDTLVRAYRRIDRYRDTWRFSTWIFTIAHRLAISHMRSAGRRESHREDAAQHDASRSVPREPGRDLMDRESRQRFWEMAQGALTEEQFAAVWLFYVEEMNAKDIALVLGRSWVSVKTMLFRARARLELRLREMSPEARLVLIPAPSSVGI